MPVRRSINRCCHDDGLPLHSQLVSDYDRLLCFIHTSAFLTSRFRADHRASIEIEGSKEMDNLTYASHLPPAL